MLMLPGVQDSSSKHQLDVSARVVRAGLIGTQCGTDHSTTPDDAPASLDLLADSVDKLTLEALSPLARPTSPGSR